MEKKQHVEHEKMRKIKNFDVNSGTTVYNTQIVNNSGIFLLRRILEILGLIIILKR